MNPEIDPHTKKRTLPIETGPASAEHLPFDDGSFDSVACRYSAHHWRDLDGFLRLPDHIGVIPALKEMGQEAQTRLGLPKAALRQRLGCHGSKYGSAPPEDARV
ncbi:methyltransferase domain-containing protein [Methylacidimicrobium tartarophylax]|uniref:methyltransferase domain-containing protein n=1 Tax=Methylacidimicrobium tartarophylax TaxID=1041768 RepID=UPI0035B553E2